MNNTTESSDIQFRKVSIIRAAAMSTETHAIVEPESGVYACSCGYGLGDASGNLPARFADHLTEASA